MKRFFGALAAAAMMIAPASATAQLPVDPSVSVILRGHPFSTAATGYIGTGGGYTAEFSVDFPAPIGATFNFTDYLIWCIDAGRAAVFDQPLEFKLYTLADFAALDFGSTRPSDPDLAAMKRIASLQNTLHTNWDQLSITERENYQGSIWAEFDGFTGYGNDNAPNIIAGDSFYNTADYYVLWNGVNQTFLTRISEPSSALLALAGMGAFVVAVRRRRIS